LPTGEKREPHAVEMSLSSGGNHVALMQAGQFMKRGWAIAAKSCPMNINAYRVENPILGYMYVRVCMFI